MSTTSILIAVAAVVLVAFVIAVAIPLYRRHERRRAVERLNEELGADHILLIDNRTVLRSQIDDMPAGTGALALTQAHLHFQRKGRDLQIPTDSIQRVEARPARDPGGEQLRITYRPPDGDQTTTITFVTHGDAGSWDASLRQRVAANRRARPLRPRSETDNDEPPRRPSVPRRDA